MPLKNIVPMGVRKIPLRSWSLGPGMVCVYVCVCVCVCSMNYPIYYILHEWVAATDINVFQVKERAIFGDSCEMRKC